MAEALKLQMNGDNGGQASIPQTLYTLTGLQTILKEWQPSPAEDLLMMEG